VVQLKRASTSNNVNRYDRGRAFSVSTVEAACNQRIEDSANQFGLTPTVSNASVGMDRKVSREKIDQNRKARSQESGLSPLNDYCPVEPLIPGKLAEGGRTESGESSKLI
jgi:hypothetical protein